MQIFPGPMVAVAILAVCTSAAAHELKIFSSRHAIAEPSGKATVYLAWGHRLPVDELTDAAAIPRYEWIDPDGTTTALRKEGVSLQENTITLSSPGIHTLAAERAPSIYSYVVNDAGERQLKRGSRREQTAGADIESGTRYVQSAKAIIVVGTPDQTVPRPVGLPIEIIPMEGAAQWKPDRNIRFQVLLNGRPLPLADIDARYVGFKPDDAWCYSTETNRSGEFVLRAQQPGTWAVRATVKKLTKGEIRDQYDLEAFTATLTFEVQP